MEKRGEPRKARTTRRGGTATKRIGIQGDSQAGKQETQENRINACTSMTKLADSSTEMEDGGSRGEMGVLVVGEQKESETMKNGTGKKAPGSAMESAWAAESVLDLAKKRVQETKELIGLARKKVKETKQELKAAKKTARQAKKQLEKAKASAREAKAKARKKRNRKSPIAGMLKEKLAGVGAKGGSASSKAADKKQ